jgi:hypothetical protein
LLQASTPPAAGWSTPSARSSGPVAPPALPGFIATTNPSVPVSRLGTQFLVGLPLGGLPSHRDHRFPRSTQKPALSSCHLGAGRRADPQQARSALRPGPTTGARFWRRSYAFDTLTMVHLCSSSQHSPDGYIPPFPGTLTTPAIEPEQLPVVWTLTLQSESDDADRSYWIHRRSPLCPHGELCACVLSGRANRLVASK